MEYFLLGCMSVAVAALLSRRQLERSERRIPLIAYNPALNLFVFVVDPFRAVRIVASIYYVATAATKVSGVSKDLLR